LAPLVVVAMELLVSFLQAFVFALLVLIYFKMAEESH
jgi:F0F1-type ATP synthase membrane subunit a